MKYNSIGEQLIAKAKELDPNYKPDKFNDMSEALNIILNNSGGDIWLDITPYVNEDMTSISQEGYDLVYNAFSPTIEIDNPSNKYAGIIFTGYKLFFNEFAMSDKIGLNFITNIDDHGVKGHIRASIYDDKSVELIDEAVSSSSKIWYDLGTYSETITQDQYNEIKALIGNNSLAGVALQLQNVGYYHLISSTNDGIFTFRLIGVGSENTNGNTKRTIDTFDLIIKADLSVSFSWDSVPILLLTQDLSSQSIPSIKTDGYQQNLTIGDGLEIKGGALISNLHNFKYGTLCLNNITSGDETLNIELSFFDYIYDSVINGANILLGTSLTKDTFPQYIKQNKSIDLIISLIDNTLTLIRALSMMPYFNITVGNDTLGTYYYNCPIKKDGSSISLFLGNQEMILNTSLTFDDTFTVEYKTSWYGD